MQERTNSRWLIYGANGFAGKLIAEEAARRGMDPVLAGRNRAEVESLAGEQGLDSRAFGLESAEQVAGELDDIGLVLNCAGPFAATADVMVGACLRRGIHYLDISGEPDMLEKHLQRNGEAEATGSVVVPAVGFDVVPGDTLARCLADRLEGAVQLEVAFFGEGSGSAGSAKTVLGMMADKCKVRRGGRIVCKPLAFSRMPVQFADRELWCMAIPWGDVATAWYSTGIPDITVYMASSRRGALILRLLSPLAPLLARPGVRDKLFARIEQNVQGLDEQARTENRMGMWGRACDRDGHCAEATLSTPEGFNFTTRSALRCVEKLLSSDLPGGCYTPTQAFGTELFSELPGTAFHWRE